MNINTQFKNIIDNSQLYSCEELPLNCRTSHIIKYKRVIKMKMFCLLNYILKMNHNIGS